MDLFGPYKFASLSTKHYAYVIVDDYSRFTWVLFLAHKDESFEAFKILAKEFKMKNILKFLL